MLIKLRQREVALCVGSMFLAALIFVPFLSVWKRPDKNHGEFHRSFQGYSVWPAYRNNPTRSHHWFKKTCFYTEYQQMEIGILAEVLKQWENAQDNQCRELFRKFNFVFSVRETPTDVIIPASFEDKINRWLGNKKDAFKEVTHQVITSVFNELTSEHTIYNPLRAKRPMTKTSHQDRQYVEDITKESAQNCDFCKGSYKRFTALDPFGRVESKHSYSVANAFKYDRWHSLVLLRNHHPLKWNEEEFLDMANTGLTWMKNVNAIQKDYVYPIIFWDLLPHAMASQIHPHIHVNVRPDQYYGAQELWRRAGETYFRKFGSNYFKELKELHQVLGLTVDFGTATAFANINPKHETEIVVLSRTPNIDFFRLIYYVLRTYLDDLDQLCFSMAITLPSLVPDSYMNADRGRMPAFARITSRGSVSSVKGDLSSMEMYGVSNVNMEPWTMIQHVQQSVNKRSAVG